jgi:hypothetical protein
MADVDIILHLLRLNSVAGVEDLTLRFASPLVFRGNPMYDTFRMDNLRSFIIDFTTRRPNAAAGKLFKYLDLPALEVLELKHDLSLTSVADSSSHEDILQPYVHGLSWLLGDKCNIRGRYPKLREVHITIDGVENEKVCEELRSRLVGNLWSDGDSDNASEAQVEAAANAPHARVHFWIRERPVSPKSQSTYSSYFFVNFTHFYPYPVYFFLLSCVSNRSIYHIFVVFMFCLVYRIFLAYNM